MEARHDHLQPRQTAFPAGTYRQMLEVWREAGWRVEALPDVRPRPGASGHQQLAAVARPADRLRQRPAVTPGAAGAGQALDGRTAQPEGAAPPELADAGAAAGLAGGRRLAGAERAASQGDPADRAGLAGRIAARRRMHWPSVDAARAHFGAKSIFARWAPGIARRLSGLRPGRRQAAPTRTACGWPSTARSRRASTTRCRTRWTA